MTKENSPYIVTSSITVIQDSTLIIMPGVEIRFTLNTYLYVYDDGLIAEGNQFDTIIFTSNETVTEPGNWGGLYLSGTDSKVKLKNCIVEYAGTGIYCSGSAYGCNTNLDNFSNIDSCIIRYNNIGIVCRGSGSSSSGCIPSNTGSSSPILSNCKIYENTQSGIYLSAYDGYYANGYVGAIIKNNIIRNNGENGILCTGDDPVEPKIINNTIVNNGENGIIYYENFDSTNFQISNNILTGNNIGIYSSSERSTYIQYNNNWSNTSGEYFGIDEPFNNLSLDPIFIEPFKHNYELQASSPCINSGDPLLTDPDNTISDIGAIYYKHIPDAMFEADTVLGEIPFEVQFSDKSIGVLSNWLWKFGDDFSSTEKNPIHTYTKEGTYTVSLLVTGADGSDTETKNDYITVSTPTSISELATDDNCMIYPNPAKTICTIKIPDNILGISNIKIFNVNGEELMSKTGIKDKFIEINLSELSIGLYYISVISEKTILNNKLIIVK